MNNELQMAKADLAMFEEMIERQRAYRALMNSSSVADKLPPSDMEATNIGQMEELCARLRLIIEKHEGVQS